MAIIRRPGHVIYSGWDRLDVEVLIDGTWHAGELRAWDHDPADDTWSASVQWSPGPGAGNRLERFAAEQVRKVDGGGAVTADA